MKTSRRVIETKMSEINQRIDKLTRVKQNTKEERQSWRQRRDDLYKRLRQYEAIGLELRNEGYDNEVEVIKDANGFYTLITKTTTMKETNNDFEQLMLEDNAADYVHQVPVKQESNLQIQQVAFEDIDDLEEFEAAPVELSSDYWTPSMPGETKKVLFSGIRDTMVPSVNNKNELVKLPCAFFVVKEDNIAKQICNGSKRLIGIIQSFNLQPGAALQITYNGKRKNLTNSFSSDDWKVFPLVPKS